MAREAVGPLDLMGVKGLLKESREIGEKLSSLWKILGMHPGLNQFFQGGAEAES